MCCFSMEEYERLRALVEEKKKEREAKKSENQVKLKEEKETKKVKKEELVEVEA